MIRAEKIKEGLEEEEVQEGEVGDEDMYADDADMAGVSVDMDSRTRITVCLKKYFHRYLYHCVVGS